MTQANPRGTFTFTGAATAGQRGGQRIGCGGFSAGDSGRERDRVWQCG